MADHSHDVTMAAHLGAQHAEPILGVMIGDALDKARQNLPIRRFRLRPHVRVISVGFRCLPISLGFFASLTHGEAIPNGKSQPCARLKFSTGGLNDASSH